MNIVGYILGLILGLVVGYMIAKFTVNPVGYLRIDKSDPDDEPYMFLELKTNPKVIEQSSYITLKVKVENYVSQK